MADPNKQSNTSCLLPPPNAGGGVLTPPKSPALLGSNLINTGSGGATGNPRNKCALKPGYSLMGWVRLGNSGVDLAGTGGRVTPVSSAELAKHKTRDDAWMAIRGKVYNVTRYMDYHPGGVDELMRGVGRDATLLFNEVHAWVNYQQLLAKCFIGPLCTVLKIDEDIAESPNGQTTKSTNSRPSGALSTEITPRFDWTQKLNELTIYIYTRTNCNPGLLLQCCGANKTLEMRVQIEKALHVYTFELQQAVVWPPRAVKAAAGESGKIEVCLTKAAAELWPAYGTHTVNKSATPADEETYEFELVDRCEFNHDSFAMRLRGGSGSANAVMCLPVGYHISIAVHVDGEMRQRSYTPVAAQFSPSEMPPASNNNDLHFLIKTYADGLLSTHLRQLGVGATLQLSAPRGNFNLAPLLPHRRFALLAAGSGLTPLLTLLVQLLRRNTNRIEHLQLYYYNKHEADIWCHTQLERLQADDARFRLTHVLSQPSAEWTEARGRLRRELLVPLLVKDGDEHATYAAICGPTAFNQLAKDLLLELQFNAAHMHVFQG